MGPLGTYQDYFWFLAGLCWVVVGLVWWRLDLNRHDWSWLPWSAGAGGIAAATQVSCWLFVAEAAPLQAPLLGVDLFLGAIAGLEVAGWWWAVRAASATARRRHLCVGAALAVLAAAAARAEWPRLGALAVVVAAAVAAAVAPGSTAPLRRSRPARIALTAAVASLAFANWGPLAGWAFDSLRWADLASTSAFAISIVQLLLAVTVLIAVLRDPLRDHFRRNEPLARREASIFGLALALWLAIGLAIAWFASHATRRELAASAFSRTRMAAELLDRRELALCLGPDFRIDRRESIPRLQGGQHHRAFSDWLTTERTRALAASLDAIARLNPDTNDVFVATLREGWIVGAVFKSRVRPLPNVVSLEHPALPDDLARWERAEPIFRDLHTTLFGTSVQAWAPLSGPDQRMLGWLVFDWDPKAWVRAQAQSRLQTFGMVALGVFLCVLLFLHRLMHRQREAAALQAQAAAAASRLKTTFLATVSHELRTPLQAIRGYGEILEVHHASASSRTLLAALRGQVDVMHRLVADLLDLSAMEAGAFRCERHPVDVRQVFADVADQARPEARAKGLGFRTDIAPDLPDRLVGDAVRLRQLLANLLSNAVKYTDNGEIAVRVAVERLEPSFCDFAVIVDDTGPGIPEERRSALFQPFSRLDASGAKEGSGLGLALSAGLARNLGGELRLLQSGPEGSRFAAALRWPIAPAAVSPALRLAAPPPHGVPGATGRVLVVDDSPAVGVLFVEYLRACGARCDLVADGREALGLLLTGCYEAALVDISLPGMNGCEIARQVRAAPPAGPRPRLVGISAHAGDSTADLALGAGFDRFLAKPVELGALAVALGITGAVAPAGLPEKLLAQLTGTFRRELPPLRQQIERALARDDWPEVARGAHQLANGAFALQASALNEASRRLEAAARAGERSEAFRHWNLARALLAPWLEPETEPPSRPQTSIEANPHP